VGFIVKDREGFTCDDSCEFAFDDVCDEGTSNESSVSDDDDDYDDMMIILYLMGFLAQDTNVLKVSACVKGTDCTDCGGVDAITSISKARAPDKNNIESCVNTCAYARDGVCDDPRGGSKYCNLGTDCQDCGPVGADNFTRVDNEDGLSYKDEVDYDEIFLSATIQLTHLLPTYSLTHSLTHALTRSLTHSLTHLLIHSLTTHCADFIKGVEGNSSKVPDPERSIGRCDNTCPYARDGVCDDPRIYNYCKLGTDCQDCGPVGADNFTDTVDDDGWWDDDDDQWSLKGGNSLSAIIIQLTRSLTHSCMRRPGQGLRGEQRTIEGGQQCGQRGVFRDAPGGAGEHDVHRGRHLRGGRDLFVLGLFTQ
jgi:hypothetical protein